MLANSSFLCYAVKPGTVSVSTKADLRLRGFASFWQAVVLNIWRVVTFKGVVLMGQVFICLVFFFCGASKSFILFSLSLSLPSYSHFLVRKTQ